MMGLCANSKVSINPMLKSTDARAHCVGPCSTGTKKVKSMNETQVGHCKRDETDVYIGRGQDADDMLDVNPTRRGWLGNPFTLDGHSREESIRRFRMVFEWRLEADPEFREAVKALHGKTLGCWCQGVDEKYPACHGEVIAE